MTTHKTVLVTGGTGFIGSSVIRFMIAETDCTIVNVDKLTYASNPTALAEVEFNPRYHFEHADIGDRKAMDRILAQHQPIAIMHLAAESHVDRSIDKPSTFVETNVVGTMSLLESALAYWHKLPKNLAERFRFHHISTDEVFGSLPLDDSKFTEQTPYAPNSPYSASKAASDHFVRAWHHTFGLPIVTSNCSNNYGPWQFPEKLIPLMIIKAFKGESLPVYGNGQNIRDWLHVEDHARALWGVLTRGETGETYNIGGDSERKNVEVVEKICDLIDELAGPMVPSVSRRSLIQFVADRPGHDLRYAIDASKIQRELNWRPRYTFDTGLKQTIEWYLENRDWWDMILGDRYQGERLGMARAS